MLSQRYPLHTLEQVLVPRSAYRPHPTVEERSAWTSLPDPIRQAHLAKAEEHPGSWWPDWMEWIKQQDARQVKSRKPGGGKLTPIEDAPGSYVKVKD